MRTFRLLSLYPFHILQQLIRPYDLLDLRLAVSNTQSCSKSLSNMSITTFSPHFITLESSPANLCVDGPSNE